MILIKLEGYIGNQLFYFALYESLKAQGKEVKLDNHSEWKYESAKQRSTYRLFDLDYELASPKDIKRALAPSFPFCKYPVIEDTGSFNPDIFHVRNAYLVGYWQSEQYFSDPVVRQRIRNNLVPPPRLLENKDYQSLLREISQKPSVSLHIRRTDYLNPANSPLYDNICTPSYYQNAIDTVLKKEPNAHFYVFSDDKDYAKKHFTKERFTVVDSTGQEDLFDFFLMRFCRHHILANSTFSWWPAWLDDNPDSIICAPEKWINKEGWGEDIYTPRMIRIP
ncbi:MAG: alpha-1,2-fucosyltransferase, partial [Erysipelotrichaceae bacterium]|nr:alpha-1,2-fucosyltransferase [Erysipelotrichaceae bacterium]